LAFHVLLILQRVNNPEKKRPPRNNQQSNNDEKHIRSNRGGFRSRSFKLRLFCQQVSATQITGSIIMSVLAMASGDSGSGTTTISFTNPGWTVLTGIGDYSSVTFGTPATLTAFSFTGTRTALPSLGLLCQNGPLRSGNTYSFTSSRNQWDNDQRYHGHFGSGIAHITGFDDTPASWALEALKQLRVQSFSLYDHGCTGWGSAVSLLGMRW